MKIELKTLTRTAILLGLTLAFQSLRLPQPVTGPIINAVLYTAAGIIGPISGVIIGATTPWIAYAVGISRLAPAVPVIMLGNISLVVVFALLVRANKYVAAIAAAAAKWAVMSLGVKYIVAPQIPIPPPVYASLTILQLWTALGGAALSLLVMASLHAWQTKSHKA